MVAFSDGETVGFRARMDSQNPTGLGYRLPPYDTRLRKIGSPRLLA